eukprot:6981555-Pyramimonas_sp.AAC.1
MQADGVLPLPTHLPRRKKKSAPSWPNVSCPPPLLAGNPRSSLGQEHIFVIGLWVRVDEPFLPARLQHVQLPPGLPF